MATILLSAAGAALGAGFGGTVLGLSGAVIGRAVGATLGRVIDQKVLGSGSDSVEIGRVERFRMMGASEGAAIPRLWGRQRIAGQVIWATRFQEHTAKSGGGKGASRPSTTSYSYTVSLAVALCEGEILSLGRIWADGAEIAPGSLNLRLYKGSEDQLPDPKIEAVEGAGTVPAYRGLAYVVIEDLEVGPYGNRVPQLSFEVMRRAPGAEDLAATVAGVCLIPGSGEYALATTPVHYTLGPAEKVSANMNSAAEVTDFAASLAQLQGELPECGATALVVSWFGDDLRCGTCAIRPKVERTDREGAPMVWRAGGITRAAAMAVPQLDGRPVYGGTPADASVVEAIRALRDAGKAVTFYPFILMDQMAGNTLSYPWSEGESQPALPWRGRISLSVAPGRAGSPDRSAAAEAEVAAFFGTATPGHFGISGSAVSYSGPAEWGFRRFILHYAALCKAAGGVDSFCIGSEMRGLTQIRGAGDSFPAVQALRALAADVRAILGPATKIGYAADWSEYFGCHTGGDVYFHLDPLWADANVDFVGIDNYMPLSDWRAGEDHADAAWPSVYDPGYLTANVAGGEYYDWYYDGPEAVAAQNRKPIGDGAWDEPWVFRPKDIRGWWSNAHHDRIDGVRAAVASPWVPGSKPVRFVEYGCAAIDGGANQPNVFLDPKSSESALPRGSDGRRDDLMQMAYLAAMHRFWRDPANNPEATAYEGRMVDMDRSHVWAWDVRPFPAFPGRDDLWGDTANHARGHWLNGRTGNQPLDAVVRELFAGAGPAPDLTRLQALVRGYVLGEIGTLRAALQPLMQAAGAEAVERDGELRFSRRDGRARAEIDAGLVVVGDELEGTIEYTRAAASDEAGRLRLSYVEADGDYESRTAEAALPDGRFSAATQSDLPLVLTAGEARAMAESWLAQVRIARDVARFALPPSAAGLGAGDVVALGGQLYRIDRLERTEAQLIDAVRVEPGAFRLLASEEPRRLRATVAGAVPVGAIFLDLPLLTGDEVPHAPHLAVAAQPWPGTVGVWSSDRDDGYELNRLVERGATVGVTETALAAARPGLWDRGADLVVRVSGGALASADPVSVLNGANAAAIGDGGTANWEVFQFAGAELIAPSTWALRRRLRGQAGTDGVMPAEWPVGSTVVFLTQAVGQIRLAAGARGLERWYRVGVASRGNEHLLIDSRVEAFDGIGLRPYPVAHLRARRQDGDLVCGWVRRGRIDADNWQSAEIPPGEEREAYRVELRQGTAVLLSAEVAQPAWTLTAAARAALGVAGAAELAVAQLSDRFGAGPWRVLSLDLPS